MYLITQEILISLIIKEFRCIHEYTIDKEEVIAT